MNVLTHGMIGWLVAQPLTELRDRRLVTAAALLADVDGLTLVAGVDSYQRWHHTFGHNLFFAASLSAACALFARQRLRAVALAGVAALSHLVCDLLGSGADWPIPLFWPISRKTTSFPPPFQWELASWQNFTVSLLCLAAILWIGRTRQRTVVEFFSVNADRKVAEALRARF